jgi:hypothetical protein
VLDLVKWLDRFSLFRRDKIPLIGFGYNQFYAATGPPSSIIFPGAIVSAGSTVFPVFDREGTIAKIKLGFSVHANAANAVVGAYAVKVTGATANGTTVIVTPTTTVLAGIATRQEATHIQQTVDFMPYGGYRMQSGETVVLAITDGGGGGIVTLGSLLIYAMYQPARIIIDPPGTPL